MTFDEFEALVATAVHPDVPLEVPLRDVLRMLRQAGVTSSLSLALVAGRTQYRYRGQLLGDSDE